MRCKTADLQEVRKLSEKLVDKVFTDYRNHYTTFKKFDQDNDGYVSYDDFVGKVKSLEIEGCTDEAALTLAK